ARGGSEQRVTGGQIERDATVGGSERLETSPEDFARSHQEIEVRRAIRLDPRRQDLGLDRGGGKRRALELLDRGKQSVEARPRPGHALPSGLEPRERGGLDGFDLFSQ